MTTAAAGDVALIAVAAITVPPPTPAAAWIARAWTP